MDVAGEAAAQPMQDVDVVRALLQQAAGGVAAIRVPILEIEIAAPANEVPAPRRLDFADQARGR